jgi:hypothetical protein
LRFRRFNDVSPRVVVAGVVLFFRQTFIAGRRGGFEAVQLAGNGGDRRRRNLQSVANVMKLFTAVSYDFT